MKKLYYIAASLLILAGAASCEKKTNVQEPDQQQSGKMIPFSVTAGQGGKKTAMVDGVLSWIKDDQITVLTQAGAYETELTLKGDGGSATGEFSGEIAAAVADKTELYGLYNATYNSGNFSVTIPTAQTYNATSFQEGIFPSIGTGTYQKNGNTAISFQNPMGIIRLKLNGTESIKSVQLTAANSNIAGDFTVSPALAVSGGTSKAVTISSSDAVALSNDGTYFNFVTAPFASQAVNVLVTKSDNSQYGVNITASVKASEATRQDVEEPEPKEAACGTTVACYTPYVTDVCGNTYPTVKIGNQIWMAENMRCNKYSANSDADAGLKGDYTIPSSTQVQDDYTPYIGESSYTGEGNPGYFYSWAAAVGVTTGYMNTIDETGNRQGICPDGWHVPSNNEFEALRTYIKAEKSASNNNAGRYLSNTTGWYFSGQLDCYGFAALAAGFFYNKACQYPTYYAYYWTINSKASTGADRSYAHQWYILTNYSFDTSAAKTKNYANNVRCVKD